MNRKLNIESKKPNSTTTGVCLRAYDGAALLSC